MVVWRSGDVVLVSVCVAGILPCCYLVVHKTLAAELHSGVRELLVSPTHKGMDDSNPGHVHGRVCAPPTDV